MQPLAKRVEVHAYRMGHAAKSLHLSRGHVFVGRVLFIRRSRNQHPCYMEKNKFIVCLVFLCLFSSMSVSAISHYPREKCTRQAGHHAKNVSKSFLTPSSPIHLMNVTRAECSKVLGCFIQVIQWGWMPFIAVTWLQLGYRLYWMGNAFLAVGTDIGKLQSLELTP